jgi:hypothetical protein
MANGTQEFDEVVHRPATPLPDDQKRKDINYTPRPQTDSIVADHFENPLSGMFSIIPSEQTMKESQAELVDIQQRRLGAEERAEADMEKRDADWRGMMKEKFEAEGAELRDLQPWNAQTMAPPPTDLWAKLGSPGFLIAMMASHFTGNPMMSAMNGGAAAMEAINKGDTEAYNRAFDVWRENSNLMIKRFNMEHQELQDVGDMWKTDTAAARARLESVLTKYGDEAKLTLLKSGRDKDLWDSIEGVEKAVKLYSDNMIPMIEQKAIMDLANKDPDMKKGTQGMVRAIRRAEDMVRPPDLDPEKIAVRNELLSDEYNRASPEEQEQRMLDISTRFEKAKFPFGKGRGGAGALSPDVVQGVENQLAQALGVKELSPFMQAGIERILSLSGAASKAVPEALDEMNRIASDKKAGKEVTEEQALSRLNSAVQHAATTARSAQQKYLMDFEKEFKDATGTNANSDMIKRAMAQFTETSKAAQVLGTRMGNVLLSINEVDTLGSEAERIRKEVGDKYKFVPFESWSQITDVALNKPHIGELQVITAEVMAAYATALMRGGVPGENAQQRAMSLLNTSLDVKTYTERIEEMKGITRLVKKAVDTTKEDIEGGPNVYDWGFQ